MKRDDIYKYNGLKSPLWSGLYSPLFSPFSGSATAGSGEGYVSLIRNGVLHSAITFTRAGTGTATYFDSAGAMQIAAANAPRIDYNPSTLELRGLLIEESRTNLLLNSETLATQSATVTAAAHTLSFYGNGTVTLSGAHVATVNGSGAFPTRTTLTFTPSAGSLTLTVSGTVQYANLELGAFATSWIRTTGSTATRSSDAASVPKTSIGYNESESTIYAEYDLLWSTTSATRGLAGIDANGRFVYWSGTLVPSIYDGTTIRGGDAVNGSLVANKTAAGFGSTGIAIASNGGAATSSAFDGTFGAASSLNIGSVGTGQPLCGHIKNLRYYPRRLTNADLQAVTA